MFSSHNNLPFGKSEREKALQKAESDTENLQAQGLERTWQFLDSGLLPANYDLADASYSRTFGCLMPGEDTLETYLIKNIPLKTARGGIVAVDVGGPGRRVMKELRYLASLLLKGQAFEVRRSLGVTIEDHNPEKQDQDALSSHTVLTGNLLTEETEENIDQWLGEDKINVLFERMLGGAELMPRDPYLVAKKLQRWYGRLDDGGIMLVQVPIIFNSLLEAWCRMLKEKYASKLEVYYRFGTVDSVLGKESVLLIRKLPEAPEKLEFLSPKAAREAVKDKKATS